MIQQVVEIVTLCQSIDTVIVATDSEEVKESVLMGNSTAEVVMTGICCRSGSERVWHTIQQGNYSHSKTQLIINVQGDEPLLKPWMLDVMVEQMNRKYNFGCQVATMVQMSDDPEELNSPNTVKAIVTRLGDAVFFTRNPIAGPDGTFYRHLGVYAYNRFALNDMMEYGVGQLEQMENLEQMRLIEMGLRVDVTKISHSSPIISVDTQEDLDKVRRLCSHQYQSCCNP
jgi:3-deoxy-manno-octulosonate cytidylyltransferase (CMP-KDO synthetase)